MNHFFERLCTAEEAAEAAANQLHEAERREYGSGIEDFDGREEVIEVETEDGLKRFCVGCEVRPVYRIMGD